MSDLNSAPTGASDQSTELLGDSAADLPATVDNTGTTTSSRKRRRRKQLTPDEQMQVLRAFFMGVGIVVGIVRELEQIGTPDKSKYPNLNGPVSPPLEGEQTLTIRNRKGSRVFTCNDPACEICNAFREAHVSDDEPIFVLRARDLFAPTVVGFWITCANSARVATPKVEDAKKVMEAMNEWREHNPVKKPD